MKTPPLLQIFTFLTVFIVFLLTLSIKSFAEEVYFDFIPENKVLNLENEVAVSLKYKLVDMEQNRFRIRPVSNVHYAQVWNDAGQKWISESAMWIELPVLSAKSKIRFASGAFLSTEIYFQVQDTLTAQIYETPIHKIWSRKWFPDYVRRLNENILRQEE